MSTVDLKAAIRDRALELGFDAVGFAAPRLAEGARADLADYLARGYHGDMGWLAKKTERRGDPAVLWPEARARSCSASTTARPRTRAGSRRPGHVGRSRFTHAGATITMS